MILEMPLYRYGKVYPIFTLLTIFLFDLYMDFEYVVVTG